MNRYSLTQLTRKFIFLAISAAIIATATPAGATVTFDFIETGVAYNTQVNGFQPLNHPVDLFSITLSSGTETGSAHFNGYGSNPVVTDPNFRFHTNLGGSIEFPFDTSPSHTYDISWTAADGELTSLSLIYEAQIFAGSLWGFGGPDTGFGLTGGYAVFMGVCDNIDCFLTGFWQEEQVQAVPEPGSAALLLGALFGFGFCGRKLAGRNQRIVGHADRTM